MDIQASAFRSVVASMLLAAGLSALVVSVGGAADAQGARGRIVTEVTENGRAASARFVVHGSGGEEVGRGVSGTPVQVAPGTYDVAVSLDGAIDRPEKWARGVRVAAGGTGRAAVAFETGALEIRVSAGGRRSAATILVHRTGEEAEVATLGAGVPAVLSAGTYDFQVRYRSQEKWLRGESVGPGSNRVLDVEF